MVFLDELRQCIVRAEQHNSPSTLLRRVFNNMATLSGGADYSRFIARDIVNGHVPLEQCDVQSSWHPPLLSENRPSRFSSWCTGICPIEGATCQSVVTTKSGGTADPGPRPTRPDGMGARDWMATVAEYNKKKAKYLSMKHELKSVPLVRNASCGHAACVECWRRYIESRDIETGYTCIRKECMEHIAIPNALLVEITTENQYRKVNIAGADMSTGDDETFTAPCPRCTFQTVVKTNHSKFVLCEQMTRTTGLRDGNSGPVNSAELTGKCMTVFCRDTNCGEMALEWIDPLISGCPTTCTAVHEMTSRCTRCGRKYTDHHTSTSSSNRHRHVCPSGSLLGMIKYKNKLKRASFIDGCAPVLSSEFYKRNKIPSTCRVGTGPSSTDIHINSICALCKKPPLIGTVPTHADYSTYRLNDGTFHKYYRGVGTRHYNHYCLVDKNGNKLDPLERLPRAQYVGTRTTHYIRSFLRRGDLNPDVELKKMHSIKYTILKDGYWKHTGHFIRQAVPMIDENPWKNTPATPANKNKHDTYERLNAEWKKPHAMRKNQNMWGKYIGWIKRVTELPDGKIKIKMSSPFSMYRVDPALPDGIEKVTMRCRSFKDAMNLKRSFTDSPEMKQVALFKHILEHGIPNKLNSNLRSAYHFPCPKCSKIIEYISECTHMTCRTNGKLCTNFCRACFQYTSHSSCANYATATRIWSTALIKHGKFNYTKYLTNDTIKSTLKKIDDVVLKNRETTKDQYISNRVITDEISNFENTMKNAYYARIRGGKTTVLGKRKMKDAPVDILMLVGARIFPAPLQGTSFPKGIYFGNRSFYRYNTTNKQYDKLSAPPVDKVVPNKNLTGPMEWKVTHLPIKWTKSKKRDVSIKRFHSIFVVDIVFEQRHGTHEIVPLVRWVPTYEPTLPTLVFKEYYWSTYDDFKKMCGVGVNYKSMSDVKREYPHWRGMLGPLRDYILAQKPISTKIQDMAISKETADPKPGELWRIRGTQKKPNPTMVRIMQMHDGGAFHTFYKQEILGDAADDTILSAHNKKHQFVWYLSYMRKKPYVYSRQWTKTTLASFLSRFYRYRATPYTGDIWGDSSIRVRIINGGDPQRSMNPDVTYQYIDNQNKAAGNVTRSLLYEEIPGHKVSPSAGFLHTYELLQSARDVSTDGTSDNPIEL